MIDVRDHIRLLFDPASHEPVTTRSWDDERIRSAIAAIVADTEGAFDDNELWRPHPVDEADGPLPQVTSLYLGAAGVIWALHELEDAGVADLRRNWTEIALRLVELYETRPDFPELVDGPVPSLWMGEAGILLVAHTLAPATWQENRLLTAIRRNTESPAHELMWGSPGTMLVAQVMAERTGVSTWRDAWIESADHLWHAWEDEVWTQEIYGDRVQYLGPAHGFAGVIVALARGDFLAPERRVELERRTTAVLVQDAEQHDGLAQWPPISGHPLARQGQAIRTQWCHGAPGIVSTLASIAPHDDDLTTLLAAGGELTWRAGPLKKGTNLCHGTAGNGYAFLKLFERTGDEEWLMRARSFAMHSIEQVERASVEYGRGRHTLWTGDLGTALYLRSCLAASAAFPTLDEF